MTKTASRAITALKNQELKCAFPVTAARMISTARTQLPSESAFDLASTAVTAWPDTVIKLLVTIPG